MVKNKVLLSSSFFLALLLLQSCGGNGVQAGTQDLPKTGWPLKAPVRFSITPLDTLKAQSMWLTLRHDNNYPFSNIFLITTLTHPHGQVITDTLSFNLAAPNGQWLGSGTGVITHKLPYKKAVVFNRNKPYTLAIYQSVRTLGETKGLEVLPGVIAVGYSIEYSN